MSRLEGERDALARDLAVLREEQQGLKRMIEQGSEEASACSTKRPARLKRIAPTRLFGPLCAHRLKVRAAGA